MARSPEGRGIVLAANRGGGGNTPIAPTPSITDEVEVGRRVAGPVRLAFEVANVRAASASLQAQGAEALREPVKTTWGDLNQRLRAPDGMQISLFQLSEPPTESTDDH